MFKPRIAFHVLLTVIRFIDEPTLCGYGSNFRIFSLRWLHAVSHQFQETNIRNFFDDFQDSDPHFSREKLQKQLA